MGALAFNVPGALRLGFSVLVFQGAWFACVLSAARGHPLLGTLAVAAALALQVAASDLRKADIVSIGVAVAIGLVSDTLLAQTDVVRYASSWPQPGLAPIWILALWALWGAVLREPLRWLHKRPLAAALLGTVGGPASYAAAARLGACSFPDITWSLLVLALGWAVITPLQLTLAARLERGARASR
ncbi:MAG TPA: DUF2878 domain-containing protein [Burkholderiales bacterium]|nr:DUF2878 domain-containing protein [Burkholderiales bacterium]